MQDVRPDEPFHSNIAFNAAASAITPMSFARMSLGGSKLNAAPTLKFGLPSRNICLSNDRVALLVEAVMSFSRTVRKTAIVSVAVLRLPPRRRQGGRCLCCCGRDRRAVVTSISGQVRADGRECARMPRRRHWQLADRPCWQSRAETAAIKSTYVDSYEIRRNRAAIDIAGIHNGKYTTAIVIADITAIVIAD
jgi:hypothetical protein